MGVMNSFTAAAFLIGVVSKGFVGWVVTAVFVSVCLFLSRELGRYSYKKREKKYLHQTGILLGDLPNKAKAEIHGKKVTVWSRDEIKKGTQICVTEMKGTYLYVSAVDQKQSSVSFDL